MAQQFSLTIRISSAEKEELEAQASICDLTCSNYARKKIFDLAPETSSDIQIIKSTIVGLRHDIKEAAEDHIIMPSESRKFLNSLAVLYESVSELNDELKRENQLAFQMSVKDDHLSDKDKGIYKKVEETDDSFLDNDDLF